MIMKKNLLLLPTFAMALFCACTENVNQQESTYPQPCMEGNSGNWVYNTQISDEFEAPFDTANGTTTTRPGWADSRRCSVRKTCVWKTDS